MLIVRARDERGKIKNDSCCLWQPSCSGPLGDPVRVHVTACMLQYLHSRPKTVVH